MGGPYAQKLGAFLGCRLNPFGFRNDGSLDGLRLALSNLGSRRFPTRGSPENVDVAGLCGDLLTQEFLGLCHLGVPLRELLGSQETHNTFADPCAILGHPPY